MEEHVTQLCQRGKGILASDESTGTIGKRFEKVGLNNDEETRRSYRELFYTADVGEYFSGAIMFKETLYQSSHAGQPFVDCLKERGILAGIKVDEGLAPIEGTDGETETKGLQNLTENMMKYKAQGATFTKWRAALKVGDGCPSEKAIQINAEQLAEYAIQSQHCGLVPIVEPEILLDGTQSMSTASDASARTLAAVMRELWRKSVVLEHCLLKPQMMVGIPATPGEKSQLIAQETLRTMQRFVPVAIPGIMFLSGGQSEADASLNLASINKEALDNRKAPWRLSFSFGRALQASVLKIWSEDMVQNEARAQRKVEELAQVNSAASKGIFCEHHPSILGHNLTLSESFRGWSGAS